MPLLAALQPLRLVRNKGDDRPKLTARGQFGRFGFPVNDDMTESVVGEHPSELSVDLIPYLIGISPCAQLQTDAQRARRGLNDLEQLDTHCTRDLEAHHERRKDHGTAICGAEI